MTDTERTLADEFNSLRGRILGLIESWGLPERQESGCKATFKSLTYDAQARILDTLQERVKHLEEIEWMYQDLCK